MSELTLDCQVYGMLKFARLQAHRERTTRGGFVAGPRRMADDVPDDVPDSTRGPCEVLANGEQLRRERRIVLRQLREFTPNPLYRRLLVRRLLRGEKTEAIARELALRPPTARKVVMRAREYLGLKE